MTSDYSLPDLIDTLRLAAELSRQRLEDAMLRRSIARLMGRRDQWKMDAAWKAHEVALSAECRN
jgi:hypothetical protein